MTLIVTLLIRDEDDILPAMIEHHLAAGADHLIVTDNASGPASADLLRQYARTGRVSVRQEPDTSYRQDVWVTRMAREAAREHGADWVINADADEFYWPLTPDGDLVPGPLIDLPAALASVPTADGRVVARRDNLVSAPDRSGPWPRRLQLRDTLALSERGTRIGDKTIHRADPDVRVAFGNHDAVGPEIGPRSESVPLIVLHAPDRSYEAYAAKIEKGGAAVSLNPDLSPDTSWHWRADYQRLLDGTLEQTWRSRQPSPERVAHGVSEGVLLPEVRLLRRLEYLQARTLLPGVLDDVLDHRPRDVGRWRERLTRGLRRLPGRGGR